MTKEEAAEAYGKSTFLSQIKGPLYKTCFIAGWEAREAQFPTDAAKAHAITFIKFLIDRGSIVLTLKTDKIWTYEDAYKLFNPSGAAPQADSNALQQINQLCINCRVEYDLSNKAAKTLAECLEEIFNIANGATETSAPQAAGPVWVKGVPKLPGYYHLSADDKESYEYINPTAIELGYWNRMNYRYLDETNTQQLFTRDEVENILNDYASDRPERQSPFAWFNNKYPTK